MSQAPQTMDEVIDSCTGFDEMEIATQFGRTLGDLTRDRTMLSRSMVYVVKRREGLNDDDARNAALGMVLKDVLGFFAEESEESGKDEPSVEPSPMSAPAGVSEQGDPETSS